MATTKVKDSRQKKLTTTPTPTPSDSRRQTTRPSPSSSTKSSRSTSPTSPKRGRPLAPSSTGMTKPLPNYLKPTESSRTICGARLADSSSKHIKKHTSTTTTSTTGHDTKAASSRRRSMDRSTSSSALPSSNHVHTKVGTSAPPIRERLAARSSSFASRPAPPPHRGQSKAPKATTAVSNKSHVSSGSGKGTLKKTTAAIEKEVLENESSNALEKVSGVAGIGDERQMPSSEAIEELKEIEQNKVGGNEEEIVQELEIPDYPESEYINETELENMKDDILEPVEESLDADQVKQTEETILEDQILEPDDNNNTNHEDNGEQMDEVKGENKSVSPPPVKSSSIEETDSKAEEDNHKDTDENLDHAVRREENSAPEVHEEEDGKKEAETCNEKEQVVVVEEESPAAKPVPVEEEAPKTSIGAAKGTAGKKDSPAYNDVIEETATKLLEKRKNKVKALVGAFETVISLDAN